MGDFDFGEGDSYEITSTLRHPQTKEPLDLTGCSATIKVAPDDGTGPLAIRSVTIDPDQVNNKGKVIFRFFDPGSAAPARYNARVKLLAPNGDRMSFDSDRLLLVEVSADPS
jgi:hypothetical protein